MDATTTQWSTQGGFGVPSKPMELIASSRPVPQEIRRTRPQKEQALNCPRCNSTNTKFCYYNNYSLSQPRYFCKTCRRYWTEGGSLRNVPVGGGSRKNKRSSSSSSASSSSSSSSTTTSTKIINSNISKLSHDHHLGPPIGFNPNPSKMMIHEGQDLNIAYPPPPADHQHQNPTSSSSSSPALSIDLLKCTSGITSMGLSMSLNSFMHMPHVPDSSSSAGFHHHHHPLLEFKPTSLGFSGGYHHDHHGFGSNGYGNLQGLMQQETGTGGSTTGGAKLLFPVEELKQLPSDTAHEFDQNRGQGADSSNGYWNGVFGGGSW